ncbi:MAG: hypothetical protein ACM3OC_06775 [Deltaproteobacteria bacterium]
MATVSETRAAPPVNRVFLTKGIINAQRLLRFGFTVIPIVAGLDKFFHFLVNWNVYLNPAVASAFPGGATSFMHVVGVIEIVAGLLVALAPSVGGTIVGLWELAIVINLLSIPGYYDIAARDFGLALGAFSLAMLSRGIGSCRT